MPVPQHRHRQEAPPADRLDEVRREFWIALGVRDVHDGPIEDGARGRHRASEAHGKGPLKGLGRAAGIPLRGQVEHFALEARHDRVLSVAQPAGAAHDRVEHGLDVGGRAADHAQDLPRRRLLLERLRQLAVARLQLPEQPHVLDGDDRLVGEGLEQRHLTF